LLPPIGLDDIKGIDQEYTMKHLIEPQKTTFLTLFSQILICQVLLKETIGVFKALSVKYRFPKYFRSIVKK
jgi:hypothetical protein